MPPIPFLKDLPSVLPPHLRLGLPSGLLSATNPVRPRTCYMPRLLYSLLILSPKVITGADNYTVVRGIKMEGGVCASICSCAKIHLRVRLVLCLT